MIELLIIIATVSVTIFIIYNGSKKNRVEKIDDDPRDSGIFCLCENKKLRILLWVCCGGFALFVELGVFICFWQGVADNIVPLLVFVAFFCITLYCALKVENWEINVNGKDIIYRNWLGRNKKYRFDELQVRTTKNLAIVAYQNNKRVFKIDSSIPDFSYFLWWAKKYDVWIE
jgi:hypothetical protein